MLVNAGEEVCFSTFEALIAGKHVGENFLIGVADMRFTVWVVDGSGDVEHVFKSFRVAKLRRNVRTSAGLGMINVVA
jgi:hypothetical protein